MLKKEFKFNACLLIVLACALIVVNTQMDRIRINLSVPEMMSSAGGILDCNVTNKESSNAVVRLTFKISEQRIMKEYELKPGESLANQELKVKLPVGSYLCNIEIRVDGKERVIKNIKTTVIVKKEMIR